MKFTVMGAGAVGMYFGGLLARAGHSVTLVARPEHVQAIRERGLRLQTPAGTEHIALAASTEPNTVRDADWVLFCVKSTDTLNAAAAMQPHLSPQTQVLSLQNGVDNAERLQTVLHRPVWPAVVYVATEMTGPGHVRQHGGGELLLPRAPALAALDPTLPEAGIGVHWSDDVAAALWTKLIVNCCYNALSAVGRSTYGPMVRSVGMADVMRDVVRECLAVAHADGVTVPEGLEDTLRRIAHTMPHQQSSTAQDLARGRPTEIDHLNGYVVRRGEALGVPTPVNRVLYALVKLLEQHPCHPAEGPPGTEP